jgi:putative ABC transport system permease protein
MLFNYSKIAIRNLLKNRLFSTINILGMSISLAIVFTIALFVNDELGYDAHISHPDQKFRVYNYKVSDGGDAGNFSVVPYPFATYLQKDYPEIESTLRIMDTFGENLFEAGDKRIQEAGGIYAEPTITDMLSLNFLIGDPANALEKPNCVVLTKQIAKKYFGDQNPLGKLLKISKEDYTVSGVIEDPPRNFHLKINYLLSFASLTKNWIPYRFENFINQQYITYIKLRPGTDVAALEAKFPGFIAKYADPKTKPEGFSYLPHLQRIKDIHLHSSDFQWEIAQRGNAQMVYILTVTAVLILVIACLNFINLSTARSIKRMKEVGVRKVVGAQRIQLIFQFVTESVIISLTALMVAIATTSLILPLLNNFTEKSIADPFRPLTILVLIIFTMLLGFLAGSYPALQLSRFRPAAILSHKENNVGGAEVFRKSLVVMQFVFSLFLIISAMVVMSQNDWLRNKDLGFNKEQLLVLKLTRNQMRNSETLKNEYSNHPNVLQASLSYGLPGDIVAGDGVTDVETGKHWSVSMFIVDTDYINTMGMEVVAGKGFTKSSPYNLQHGFILNETAAKAFGYGAGEKALGKKLHWNIWGTTDSLKNGEVIGVLKDFHFRSLREKVVPIVMHVYPSYFWTLTLRVKPDGLQQTLAHLKSTWEKAENEWPFEYGFLDKNFDDMYKNEARLSTLLTWFTGFAIFIACLGLFGLVEYSVNQRAKEISIRKVFGASIPSLLLLLAKHYFLLVLIAFIMVIPLSYYTSQQWLENFAYRIDISPLVFIKAAGLIVMITLITVIFQSLKAALSNPANVLKNDN